MTHEELREEEYKYMLTEIHGVLYEFARGELSDTQSALNKIDSIIHPKLDQAVARAREERDSEWKKNVGQLRQWLNEERIFAPDDLVTNEHILHWLSPDTSNNSQQ